MKYDRQRSPSEIEAEIVRVRREMDTTLSEIEGRLTTGQLVDQGLDYLKNSGAREFASNLTSSVKYNPLPVTLVGIGLAWLMFASRRGAGAGAFAYEGTGQSTGLKEHASEALNRVSESAASARDTATRSMHAASQRWAETAGSVRDRARQATESGRRQAERAREGFQYMLREQPLALGAIGVAVGAVVAAAVPRTRQEDEWMGEASDRLSDQARQMGREQLDKARQAAGTAAHGAAESASQHSPHSRPHDNVREHAQTRPQEQPAQPVPAPGP
jgi:uncharacterized protein DUF3618